ncbi:glutamate racemase [Acidihalobacter prosperus]|uniref:Glutamate racemase n=1 Tax=Acidihalobacter prosperus TaxID=160660 RepID=A0A1A6C5M8_9GAMM|nr:glutamate racemase [Acidihalobacter prosperus]OBS09854.1 glutamate racemase [Acidihalobacter prosperus]
MDVLPAHRHRLPIGVFDSGVGGLTVLRALRQRLPAEDLLYLGDMARLPYGTKSPQTVARYACQAAGVLVGRGIKLLVVACNTASALALEALRAHFPELPVIGVLEPGAAAACAATRSGRIAVIATEGTVRGGAYVRAIRALRPETEVSAAACPLFVPLAEEGWHSGPVVESVARHYLTPLLENAAPDVLVLGCTHFPVFGDTLRLLVGQDIELVDSATTTADAVAEALSHGGLAAPTGHVGESRYMTTDAPERFARVAAAFLGNGQTPTHVELVDL